MRSRSINFDGHPCRFSVGLLLRVVRFVKEQWNMMLLQESEKVSETLNLNQQIRFV